MEISLDCLKPGQQGVVTCIDTAPHLTRRLRAFALIPGTLVRCRYRGPGGHVTALEFRGSVIAMRRKDLQKIQVRC